MHSPSCPYCGSQDLVQTTPDQVICGGCGRTFPTSSLFPQPQNTEEETQGIHSTRTSSGKILQQNSDGFIFKIRHEDKETPTGIESDIIHSFAVSGSGLLIHDDKEAIGKCSACNGLVHASEGGRCEYHSNHELLCRNCQHTFEGRTYCKKGYTITLLSKVGLFPIKASIFLTKEIMKALFLKQKS